MSSKTGTRKWSLVLHPSPPLPTEQPEVQISQPHLLGFLVISNLLWRILEPGLVLIPIGRDQELCRQGDSLPVSFSYQTI